MLAMTMVVGEVCFRPPRHFDNAAQWLHALGDVPLERVIFDPWPGTATEADLLRLVDRDKRLCELIDGTLVEKPMGNLEANVAMRLGARLTTWSDAADAGAVSGADTTLQMANGRIRLPDVAFFSRQRLPGGFLPSEAIPELAPDLVVEVLSESNTAAEMQQKLQEFFHSGTKLAWVVDLRRRTVAIHHTPDAATRILSQNDMLEGEDVAPGFTMAVSDLFRNVPPMEIGR